MKKGNLRLKSSEKDAFCPIRRQVPGAIRRKTGRLAQNAKHA
jgi:hypothetical protein